MSNDDLVLEIEQICCDFGGEPVVRDFSLQLRRGSIACLLGPSGCGKTTALRAVAGFQPLQAGAVRLRGRTVSTPSQQTPPEHRGVGMVFQDYALFPHLSIGDNIQFGLAAGRGRARGKKARQRCQELLTLVGLADRADHYPHQLSGGQQQRVALARALAPEPDLILLDEPFSSLDGELRERLAYEVRDILRAQRVSALLVTHDQFEAFAVGEQVGVMRAGRLLQWDTPYQLYHEPGDRFVAEFIGQGRFVAATLLGPDTLETSCGVIRGRRALLWPSGSKLDLLLRPDDVIPDPQGALEAAVAGKAFKGAETLYTLRLDNGTELLSLFPSHHDHAIGERVRVRIDAEHLVVFPSN